MQLLPGAEVNSSLRLSRQLGAGAMGTIWAADHNATGQQVALKFMAAEFVDHHEHAFERFEREALVLEGIDHPHIIRLLGAGQANDGTPYIMLELMAGEPLIEYLEREGVFDLPVAVHVVGQLSSALATLHRRNLVHRDLKLENVFINKDVGGLHVKLFDFGLAKAPDAPHSRKPLTGLGIQVGTSEYMSPEQMLSSKDADPTADLWALAVILYLLLFGQFPFTYQGLGQLIRLVRAREFERPSQLRDDLPASLDAWFERAFDADQKERFANADEMFSSLCAAANGEATPRAEAMVAANDEPSLASPESNSEATDQARLQGGKSQTALIIAVLFVAVIIASVIAVVQ